MTATSTATSIVTTATETTNSSVTVTAVSTTTSYTITTPTSTTLTSTPTPTVTPCVIATVYGSPLVQEVVYMRYVRDELIGSTSLGRELVEVWNGFYYSWSPTVASVIAQNDWLRSAFRILLSPLMGVTRLAAGTFTILKAINTDLASTIAFTVAAFLSIEVYLVLPTIGLAVAVKKVNRSIRRRDVEA